MFWFGERTEQLSSVQLTDSSTTKPCCCRCSMLSSVRLLKYTRLSRKGTLSQLSQKPGYSFQHWRCHPRLRKITGIHYWVLALFLAHKNVSTFLQSFNAIIYYKRRAIQVFFEEKYSEIISQFVDTVFCRAGIPCSSLLEKHCLFSELCRYHHINNNRIFFREQ